jgi:hypothetical protein
MLLAQEETAKFCMGASLLQDSTCMFSSHTPDMFQGYAERYFASTNWK